MRKVLLMIMLIPAMVFGAGSAVWAQTPDGEPPSVEDVCDGQTGAAFGLCNAYCEAMDCDSPNVQASPQACAKVASKFENITGFAPPCVTPPPPPDTCSSTDQCLACEIGPELDACCADNGDPSPACDSSDVCTGADECLGCPDSESLTFCCNNNPGAIACGD